MSRGSSVDNSRCVLLSINENKIERTEICTVSKEDSDIVLLCLSRFLSNGRLFEYGTVFYRRFCVTAFKWRLSGAVWWLQIRCRRTIDLLKKINLKKIFHLYKRQQQQQLHLCVTIFTVRMMISFVLNKSELFYKCFYYIDLRIIIIAE